MDGKIIGLLKKKTRRKYEVKKEERES